MEVILSTNNVFVKKSEVLMDSCSPATDGPAKEMLADMVCVCGGGEDACQCGSLCGSSLCRAFVLKGQQRRRN